MNTVEKLKATTLQLRKDRHQLGATMQFHLSELANIGKAKNRETTEDETIQYLKKSVQKLKEDKHSNLQEADILEHLLPQMATSDEVRTYIFMLQAERGLDISNTGAVMKAVKQKFGVLVDMKMVQGML